MTVRVWLGLANCWRCGTSIQLSIEQIRQLETSNPQTPESLHDHASQQNVTDQKPVEDNLGQPSPTENRFEDSEEEAANPFETVDSIKLPWPFIISFLLNLLIILILAFLFINQSFPRKMIELTARQTKPGSQHKAILELAPVAVTQPNPAEIHVAPESEATSDQRDTSGDGNHATFFNTNAVGRRFVYIVDRSGSMNTVGTHLRGIGEVFQKEYFDFVDSRFDSAREELVRSISSLNQTQEFFVFLFSDHAQRMPLSGGELKMLPGSSKNKRRLISWLCNCKAVGGTNPTEALREAIALEPDAIFLLSDGEFMIPPGHANPASVVSRDLDIPIHTVAYEDVFSSRNLEQISKRTDGEFRFIPVTDRLGRILQTNNKSKIKMALKALSELPLHALTWRQRYDFARMMLRNRLARKTDRRTYYKLIRRLAFELKPGHSRHDDGTAINIFQNASPAEWGQFWDGANNLYQRAVSNKFELSDLRDFRDPKVQLIGMQIALESQFGSRKLIDRKYLEQQWSYFLESAGSEQFVQTRFESDRVSASNTPVAFETIALLGLLNLSMDASFPSQFLREYDDTIKKLEIANILVEYQKCLGVTEASHLFLEQIFKDKSPEGSYEKLVRPWARTFSRTVSERKKKARSLYNKFKRMPGNTRQTEFGKQIIEDYPETSYARLIRKKLDIQ